MIIPDPIETPQHRHASIPASIFRAATLQPSFPRVLVFGGLTLLLGAVGCGEERPDRVAPEYPTDVAGSPSASESAGHSDADSDEGPEPVLGEDGP